MKKGLLLLFGLFILAGCVDYTAMCVGGDSERCREAYQSLLPACEQLGATQQWKQDHPDEDFESDLRIQHLTSQEFTDQYLDDPYFRDFFSRNATDSDWWLIDYPPIPSAEDSPRFTAFIEESSRECIPIRYY